MPALALNGTVVPIALREVRSETKEIGDFDRSADGTALSRILTRKADTPLSTPYLAPAAYNTTYALLTMAPPLAATGDLVGAGYSCLIRITGTRKARVGGEVKTAIDFTVVQE